jgi:hypothetical protein
LSVSLAFVFIEGFSTQFPKHAPASAAGSALTKEQFEIPPEFLSEWMK